MCDSSDHRAIKHNCEVYISYGEGKDDHVWLLLYLAASTAFSAAASESELFVDQYIQSFLRTV